jgi:parallel beta-helix repeat protein
MILATNNLIEGNALGIRGESAIWANDTAIGTTISGNSVTGNLEGGDPSGAAINVEDYTLIMGNVIFAECHIGIRVKNFNQVLQNEVYHCPRGIVIGPDEGNLIAENFVHFSSTGIWLELSFDNTVENNIVGYGRTGIRLYGASSNEILNNTVHNSHCNGIEAIENPIEEGINAEDNLIQGNLTFFNGDGDVCFDLFDDDHPDPGVDNIWEPNIWDTANFEEED